MCDVVKGFARNRDDMLGNCKVVDGLEREWELLLRPAEHNLSNLAPLRSNGNFGTRSAKVVAVGVLKRKVDITVCFHFCINNATCKRVPFFLGVDRFSFLSASKKNKPT